MALPFIETVGKQITVPFTNPASETATLTSTNEQAFSAVISDDRKTAVITLLAVGTGQLIHQDGDESETYDISVVNPAAPLSALNFDGANVTDAPASATSATTASTATDGLAGSATTTASSDTSGLAGTAAPETNLGYSTGENAETAASET